MSDKFFGEALLRGEDPIDVRGITERVLRRDRRRMWVVGAGCVVAWMAVVMLPWSTLLPMLAKVAEYQRAAGGGPGGEQSKAMLEAVRVGTIATFVGSVASMFVAAVCTVALVVMSRRATLRQVNARLAEIAAEIRAGRKEV